MASVALLLTAPVLCAIVIALAGRRAIGVTRLLALVGPALALFVGIARLVDGAGEGVSPFVGAADVTSVAWLSGAGSGLTVGVALDVLAAIMLVVVGTVAAMVVVFSFGYLSDDPAQPRYFALLSLFAAAMSGLVVASSLPALFVAWELVGACSYLLIGFWFTRPAAARAAMKAFLVTRLGDVGLLVALAVLWRETGSLDLAGAMAAAPELAAGSVTAVALLLLAGAAGKSAQFPLHVWLPDAMEGPTPVSALIHAATMVAAGVFLVARAWPVFEAAPVARGVMLVIGVVTALGAATVALPQTDIKRVLAYSTISQLGFMFAALGAGAWQAAIFHLVTHAAFKSLLFLASGSVIHGAGTQDLREMGGLLRAMPITAATWSVGVLALAGVPPLSGFFSKDGILDAVWERSPAAGVALLFASAFTALYVVRATRLAFLGTYRGDAHPHESRAVMTGPLLVLAVPAAGLGLALPAFAEATGGHAEISVPVAAASVAVVALAAVLGWRVWSSGPAGDEALAARLSGPWRAAQRAYGGERVVELVVGGIERAAAAVAGPVERGVVDGAVRGVAAAVGWAGRGVAWFQSGEGALYTGYVAFGACLLVAVALWLGR